jgi:hypothetical protein
LNEKKKKSIVFELPPFNHIIFFVRPRKKIPVSAYIFENKKNRVDSWAGMQNLLFYNNPIELVFCFKYTKLYQDTLNKNNVSLPRPDEWVLDIGS